MLDIKLRVYFETTTFNYFFDERKGHEDVVKLFEAVKAGEFIGYTSKYVSDELRRAPEPKKSKMLALIDEYGITLLEYNTEADKLARKYIAEGAVPESQFYDSLHIAVASINGIDFIVSYNFHHINRNKTRTKTAAINIAEGYSPVIICTAEEVL